MTKYFATPVSQAQQLLYADMTKTVNNKIFKGLPIGCVRLESVRGRTSGDKFPVEFFLPVSEEGNLFGARYGHHKRGLSIRKHLQGESY